MFMSAMLQMFHEVKDEMFYSTTLCQFECNIKFNLSANENICTIARMKNIHYLFYKASNVSFIINIV